MGLLIIAPSPSVFDLKFCLIFYYLLRLSTVEVHIFYALIRGLSRALTILVAKHLSK